jgi:hypothetical protein
MLIISPLAPPFSTITLYSNFIRLANKGKIKRKARIAGDRVVRLQLL